MPTNEFFQAFAGIAGLLFVITSMLAMRLGMAQRNLSTASVAAAHAEGGHHITWERREDVVRKSY